MAASVVACRGTQIFLDGSLALFLMEEVHLHIFHRAALPLLPRWAHERANTQTHIERERDFSSFFFLSPLLLIRYIPPSLSYSSAPADMFIIHSGFITCTYYTALLFLLYRTRGSRSPCPIITSFRADHSAAADRTSLGRYNKKKKKKKNCNWFGKKGGRDSCITFDFPIIVISTPDLYLKKNFRTAALKRWRLIYKTLRNLCVKCSLKKLILLPLFRKFEMIYKRQCDKQEWLNRFSYSLFFGDKKRRRRRIDAPIVLLFPPLRYRCLPDSRCE